MLTSQSQQATKDISCGPFSAGMQRVHTLHLHIHFSELMGPPFKILELEDGTILVSDELNHRLLRFDSSGELIWQLGGKGNTLGKFYYPRGIAVAGGEIFVCDSWNHRIQVLDMGAHPLRSLGTTNTGQALFDECSDVEIDPQGRLWVVDTGNHCLKILNREGQWIQTIGRRLSKPEEEALRGSASHGPGLDGNPGFCYPHRFLIQYPFGFCVDDRGNDRLMLLNQEGCLCAELDTEKGGIRMLRQALSLIPSGSGMIPAAFLKGRELQVVNWQGSTLFRVPALRFAETQGRLLHTGPETLFQVITFDWTNQDIVKYQFPISLPPEELLLQ